MQSTIKLGEAGFSIGHETPLVRIAESSGLPALDADRDRCVALLSILDRRPLKDDVLMHLSAAASHWQRGDKALANLRLALANLPRLKTPADAYRLQAAEYLLDEGMSPRELMEALGLDPAALDLGKYDPDQPRVPAGSGRESGRWTDGTFGHGHEGEARHDGRSSVASTPSVRQSPKLIQVAANGPFSPAGIKVVPTPPGDTLDPQGLNKPLGLAEQQAIADTFNSILTGQPLDILSLDPHAFRNLPSTLTGAVLPTPIGKYTTYRVLSAPSAPDVARLVLDKGGHVFYTNNHYKSFYPIDLKATSE